MYLNAPSKVRIYAKLKNATWLFQAASLLLLSSVGLAGGDIGSFNQIGDPESGNIMSVHPSDDRRRVEPVHDVITPHVPLAPALPEGPVEVLAIANDNYGRWPLEIKQRLDVNLAVVYTRSNTEFGYHPGSVGLLAKDVEGRLLQALNQRPEVIVSEFKFERFPEMIKDRIRGLIDSGVAYIGYLGGVDRDGYTRRIEAQRDIFASSVPFAGLRRLVRDFATAKNAAENVFSLYENDRGHRLAAVWDYPRDGEAPEPSWLLYAWMPRFEEEAWNSLLAQVILWCAKREDGGFAVEMPQEPVARADLPDSIKAITARSDVNRTVELIIFDRDGRQQHRAQVAASNQDVELELPALPGGDYFVLTRLHEKDAVRDWSLQALRIAAEIEVAAVELGNKVIEHEAEAKATIRLSAAPEAGWKLRVEALDNFGRVVHRQTMEPAEVVEVAVPTAGSLHIHNYVNVQLCNAAGTLIHENRHAFTIRQPALPMDDLVMRMWAAGGSGRDWHRPWKHARDGLDITRGGPQSAAYYNMRAEVGAANIRGIEIISPEDSHGLNIEMVRAAARQWRDYPIFQYHLGDDFTFNESWTDYAREYLAEWTRQRYVTIDRLNRAWAAAYGDFSQVEPIDYAEAAASAFGADQPEYGGMCRWVDQQLAREDMLVAFVGRLSDAIREVDPRTPLALNNTIRYPGPNTGFNFWKLAKVFGNVGAYANPITHDVYRSARRKGSRHGVYSGSYGVYQFPPYYAMQYQPWRSVFNNMNAHAFWYGSPTYLYFPGLLAPDLGTLLGYREIQKNVQELKEGIAKMLFNAERQHDGIAVLYSQGSINATAFLGQISPDTGIPPLPEPEQWTSKYLGYSGGDQNVYMNCWEGLTNLLKDIGFSYETVSDECLKQGVLKEKGGRMLVLPLTLRLDNETAAAVREFVRGGGIVMADFAPGLFDGRMRPDAPGVLDDVFGVEYGGGLPRMALGESVNDENARKLLGAAQGTTMEDVSSLGTYLSLTNIRPAGAAVLARTGEGVPLLMTHEFGRGRAVLFNMLARDYQLWRTLGREMPFRQSVAAILNWAGMTPRVECNVHAVGAGRRPLQATEKVSFMDGETEYVGILRDFALRLDERIIMSDLRGHPTTIDFGRQAHVYDVRDGVYRGYRRTIDEMIHPAKARLYALLPYEVERLDSEVKYVSETGRLDLRAALKTLGDKGPGRHVLRLEVTGPEGRERREYAANLLAENGRLDYAILLGYAPDPGLWRVKLRDVATGLSSSRRIEVTANE